MTYRWTRHDGAELRLEGPRLLERPRLGAAWAVVRVVEGTRTYRYNAAALYASRRGYQPAPRDPVGSPTPAILPALAGDPPTEPGARCVVIAGRRINVEAAVTADGVWWARRAETGAHWVPASSLEAALGAVAHRPHDDRAVVEAAARVRPRLTGQEGNQ